MLKKILRKVSSNPLDQILKKAKNENKKNILLTWNRGLGDIATGMYAIVFRIRQFIKDAKITFLVRDDLKDGFSLLEDIEVIPVSFWRRKVPFDVQHTLELLKINPQKYDLIIDNLDPTNWVTWQRSTLIPKLKYKNEIDLLYKKFNLPSDKILIGAQPSAETKYGYWRNWPQEKWQQLFDELDENVQVVLFGKENNPNFLSEKIIDLRGKTNLFEMLSIIKNKILYLIAPDSGILTFTYYLDMDFPIKVISLWGDSKHGILKQNVESPNMYLKHDPLIYENKGLGKLSVKELLKHIYPKDIEKYLKKEKQAHILDVFDKYSLNDKVLFLKDLISISDQTVINQKKAILSKGKTYKNAKPLKKSDDVSEKDFLLGQEVIKNKEAACIILAGGQGTRLGFDKPKGLFEIQRKTLFEIFFDKIKKTQTQYGVELNISIMTSHLNHNEIVVFFEENNYFGFKKKKIDFFEQTRAPFITKDEKWIIHDNKILQGPDGNGSIFHNFFRSGIFEKYKNLNVKYINVFPIDNPIFNPFDEYILGYHKKKKNDVTLRCTIRKKQDEKKGVIVKIDDQIRVIEYLYLDHKIQYQYSNSGIYCYDLNFMYNVKDVDLEYHLAYKKVKDNLKAYKCEKFIFDIFEYSDKVKTLCDIEENFYSPLKEISDVKNIEKLLNLENGS